MDKQPKADQVQYAHSWLQALATGFASHHERKQKHSSVDHNGRNGMQWVETDGTPIGVVNWISQQMVGIDDHGCYHDECRIAPATAVKRNGDQQRNGEVQGDVNHVCDQ